LACDIGVRKKPSVARGPKLIMEMRQPHSTITTGVRQPMLEAFEAEGIEMAMTTTCSQSENNRWGRHPAAACTASRPRPQTKTWGTFFRRRMAVSPAEAGNRLEVALRQRCARIENNLISN
jgi:hypothetical protein